METFIATLEEKPELLEEVIELIESSFKYGQENSFLNDFILLMNRGNFKNLFLLLNKETEEVIGHIGTLQRHFDISNNLHPTLFLGGIAIKEKYRGKGLLGDFFKNVLDYKVKDNALIWLWSDLSSLYEKFNFFECGTVYQSGEQQFNKQLLKNYIETSLDKLSQDEIQEIDELYNQFIKNNLFSPKRDHETWSILKNMKQVRFFIKKSDQNKIVSYFCVDKGHDLKDIIHDYAFSLEEEQHFYQELDKFKLWSPISLNHSESKIYYTGFCKIGSPQLFKKLICEWSKDQISILSINESEIEIVFNNEEYTLSHQDFLTGIFGPNPIIEFQSIGKPLWIGGLDSI